MPVRIPGDEAFVHAIILLYTWIFGVYMHNYMFVGSS